MITNTWGRHADKQKDQQTKKNYRGRRDIIEKNGWNRKEQKIDGIETRKQTE